MQVENRCFHCGFYEADLATVNGILILYLMTMFQAFLLLSIHDKAVVRNRS